ncbi:MAG: DUF2071 domain-containing protein [Bryobacteraceae bacterium]|nr:DUF2071 domain-containing protein [Bryobacteraceae bacterium]
MRSMARYPHHEPVRLPFMFQDWENITFLHWRFPVETVAARVPPPLAVESFDGSAWVGVTPFVVNDLRPPLLPPLPWLSRFPETNCRTYVRAPDGSSGVWFFSLDAARAAAVAGARLAYRLPYFWSRMRVRIARGRMTYESARRWPALPARVQVDVEHGEPIEAGGLEVFLTARFRLFTLFRGRLAYADVDHAPWPLAAARVLRAEQSLIAAAGLPAPADPPLAHFSPGVAVRVGRPRLSPGGGEAPAR